jgi:hypothetical protein
MQWFAFVTAALVLAASSFPVASAEDKDDGQIKVEIKGKLATGIVAIGGETTGTTITARGATWDLDLGKNEALHRLAEQLNGKMVQVTGTARVVQGVERGPRTIVTVATLKPAAP